MDLNVFSSMRMLRVVSDKFQIRGPPNVSRDYRTPDVCVASVEQRHEIICGSALHSGSGAGFIGFLAALGLSQI